jgi:hypothetical protein
VSRDAIGGASGLGGRASVTTAATQPRSARSLLVEWANDQDPWIRGLIGEILRSRRAITPERVDHFYERLLIEKGLAPGTPEPAPPLELAAEVDDPEERLVLVKLDAVQNVNALAADQSIVFNDGLTVAFGRNGAGKSGYVRIFKRLAAVRGAEPVLPNVHSSGVAPPAHARVWPSVSDGRSCRGVDGRGGWCASADTDGRLRCAGEHAPRR